jgi:PBSX family phage terminase large subunit
VICPFSPKAKRFIARDPADDKLQNLLIGSVRSGKTWAMLVKMLALCRYDIGGKRYIVGWSRDVVMRNVLTDLFALVGSKNYQYNLASGHLKLFDTDWWVISANDDAAYKQIQVCNIPESFYLMLLSRLSLSGSRLYGTSNPGPPNHYIKTRLDDPEQAQDIWHETFNLDDNLSLSEEVKQRLKRSFSGVFYSRYIEGKWVRAEGLIYRDCLDGKNFYDDESAPPGLRQARKFEHTVGCDVGTVNQFALLLMIDTGREIYIDREFCWDSKKEARQKTNGEYAEDLIRFMPPDAQVVVDPAAASFKAEMLNRGIWYTDAENDVLGGLGLLASLFSLGLLKIHRVNCPILTRQLENYSWDSKAIERGGKEAPLKIDDHFPDALRYLCKTRITEWRLSA